MTANNDAGGKEGGGEEGRGGGEREGRQGREDIEGEENAGEVRHGRRLSCPTLLLGGKGGGGEGSDGVNTHTPTHTHTYIHTQAHSQTRVSKISFGSTCDNWYRHVHQVAQRGGGGRGRDESATTGGRGGSPELSDGAVREEAYVRGERGRGAEEGPLDKALRAIKGLMSFTCGATNVYVTGCMRTCDMNHLRV